MADPRLILGKIVAVNGTSPGPSATISYTIAVHDPNVEGIFTLERQVPVKRWPADLDITSHVVGDIVVGSIEANRVRWHFTEMPAFGPCPTTVPPTPRPSPEDPLVLPVVTPYPTASATSVAGSAQVAPAPGPESGE